MSKSIGTVVRGVRTPIIRQGDDLVKIVVDSLLTAAQSENIEFRDRDIVAATEAIVARAQGNYVSVDEIAEDIKAHFPEGHIGVIFPIFKPQPVFYLPKRHCQRRQKDYADAELSIRRGGQPPGLAGCVG